MLSAIWGKITGADKKKAIPDQQASVLGRLGDYTIIYPYGMYCDLPDDVWLNILGKGKAIPMTSSRPDSSRGEIIIFHPVAGSKIHFKNDGSINLNGVVIDPDGNIVTPGTINADDVTADNQDVTLSTHGHPGNNQPPTPGT